MGEYTEILREYIGESRKFSRNVYNIVGTLYRGVNNNRFTYEQGLNKLESLGGTD